MDIKVSGIDIQVTKKNIKNLHLYVKPPFGEVTVSAPLLMTTKSIENFVRINMDWIIKQKDKMIQQPRQSERQYVSGETYYIWGRQYFMTFQDSSRNYFRIKGNEIFLGMRHNSAKEQRERYVRSELRKILAVQLDRLVPKWENITGLFCESYKIRYMTTRWGTCNPTSKHIWLNLQLVEKPLECLEYVILHELTHLKVKNHGKDFVAIMDMYMADWKEVKNVLNGLGLDAVI